MDKEPWDPSVKALVAFPSVLGNTDKNLSSTASLVDAYYNQQPEVMDAVQVMRQRATSTPLTAVGGPKICAVESALEPSSILRLPIAGI